MKWIFLTAAVMVATPVVAQQFTTAAEVKPILEATKANWVAVREYDGKDLLYFTHLMAWRCGLDAVYYTVNGGSEALWVGEPCYEGEAQPNAMKSENMLPFVSFGLQAVDNVSVRLVYDDGSEGNGSYQRQSILTP